MVFLIFYSNILQANSGDPDQMPCSAASGLSLHYLPRSLKKEAISAADLCKIVWIQIS